MIDDHILNPTTVRFLFDLATKKKHVSVPDAEMLRRMEIEGWIEGHWRKRPTITPKGEIILALLKQKAGVA